MRRQTKNEYNIIGTLIGHPEEQVLADWYSESSYTKPRPDLTMSAPQRDDDLLIAVALARFSVQFEAADPELANYAWQLAADRLVEHDVSPAEAVDVLND